MAAALPVVWLNGNFLPLRDAHISPLDRGFLFGDGVYEVIPVFDGEPQGLAAHLARLAHSLRETRITLAGADAPWQDIVAGLIARNGGGDLGIYLQVTRGADVGRDQFFPAGIPATVFAFASALRQAGPASPGVRATTATDIRWGRCDIKSISLLPNILLRQRAADSGASEVILLRDGLVTEGSASSVIIVEGALLVTRPAGPELLPGTTVQFIHELAREAGLGFREEMIPEARLRAAAEIWLTGALRGVSAVTHLDGVAVGNGSPGPLWRRIAELYERRKRSRA